MEYIAAVTEGQAPQQLIHERLSWRNNIMIISNFWMRLGRGPARGVSHVACRSFKMSRVGILSRLHNAVGNLATYIWLRRSFVAISFECWTATFWPMSLVGIYPGRASGYDTTSSSICIILHLIQ